jgi:GDP-L-fucose synthase
MVMEAVGLDAGLRFDAARPDGTPRKRLNVDRLRNLGWEAKTPLRDGIRATYARYRETLNTR